MTTRFLVKQIKPCPQCKGIGIIENPAWTEYWAEHQDGRVIETEVATRQWFYDHGWGYVMLNGRLPVEEIECDECEGKKFIETEVDLFTAMFQSRITVQLSRKEQWGYPVLWVIRHGSVICSRSRYVRSHGQVVALLRCLHRAASRRGWQFRVWGGI